MSGDAAPSPTSWFEADGYHFFCLGGVIAGMVAPPEKSFDKRHWHALSCLPHVFEEEGALDRLEGAKAAVELAMHIWLEAAGLKLPGTGQ